MRRRSKDIHLESLYITASLRLVSDDGKKQSKKKGDLDLTD